MDKAILPHRQQINLTLSSPSFITNDMSHQLFFASLACFVVSLIMTFSHDWWLDQTLYEKFEDVVAGIMGMSIFILIVLCRPRI